MKKILFTLAIVFCGATAYAEKRTAVVEDTLKHTTSIIELKDTVINGVAQTDTLSITSFDNQSKANLVEYPEGSSDFSMGGNWNHDLIPLVSVVLGLSLPIIIIFIIFYFGYKTKREKYRLAQKMIESGQPLPDAFTKKLMSESEENKTSDDFGTGIKNMLIGAVLFAFLWALTGELVIGLVGLFVFAHGLTKLLTYLHHQKQNSKDNEISTPEE